MSEKDLDTVVEHQKASKLMRNRRFQPEQWFSLVPIAMEATVMAESSVFLSAL